MSYPHNIERRMRRDVNLFIVIMAAIGLYIIVSSFLTGFSIRSWYSGYERHRQEDSLRREGAMMRDQQADNDEFRKWRSNRSEVRNQTRHSGQKSEIGKQIIHKKRKKR